jgi:hypothetical protein
MNAKQIFRFSIVAVALAAAAPYAAAQGASPTRADVKASVLEARARGALIPAGEATHPVNAATFVAQRTRADARREVLQARADGDLVPAGQGMSFDAPSPVSMLARAEVKESVRVAVQRGEMIPPGEGMGPVEWHAKGYPSRSSSYASNRRR